MEFSSGIFLGLEMKSAIGSYPEGTLPVSTLHGCFLFFVFGRYEQNGCCSFVSLPQVDL